MNMDDQYLLKRYGSAPTISTMVTHEGSNERVELRKTFFCGCGARKKLGEEFWAVFAGPDCKLDAHLL